MSAEFVIAFIPRTKHLLILWLQSPSSVILEPKILKCLTVSIVSPSNNDAINVKANIIKF